MKRFGLIGYPLGHSFSKKYFTEKFARENTDSEYELFELRSINDFPALLRSHQLTGLNVTIPYKEKVIPFLDELDETARKIGAVNVIQFIKNSDSLILKGYNSDVIGFTQSILPHIKPAHEKALILGTGGASKAIDYALQSMNIQTTFVSRNPTFNQLSYSRLDELILANNLIVINTSPVGMHPHTDECPLIPYEYLTTEHLLFDVVYNPSETLFMKKGKERGAVVLNGEEMLVGQAEAAWRIWTNP
ncbi:MAG: shikimate dehydrogenase family protein [Paludibacteraceae bacterium]